MRAFMVRSAVVAVSLVLLGATPARAQAPPAAPTTSTVLNRWTLAPDFRANPSRNPFPSYRGGPAVWSLRQSRTLARDGDYPSLPSYSPTFGSAGISAWHATTPGCVRLPAIGVNTTKKSLPLCRGHVPGKAAFVRPAASHMAVVAWTSPFKGTVAISHDAISDIDRSCGDGVTYYVELGTKQLQTITIANGRGTELAQVTQQIEPGQSLYFIVDSGPNHNVACDTTQLQVTIDQMSP